MIIDNLTDISRYSGISQSFAKAAEFLRTHDLAALPGGTQEIDGPGLFYKFNWGMTEPAVDRRWETHRLYGDIQCVISGCQEIGYAHIDGMRMDESGYDEKNDIAFCSPYENSGTYKLILKPGQFMALFPQDAHKPLCAPVAPERIHLLVVKFLIS